MKLILLITVNLFALNLAYANCKQDSIIISNSTKLKIKNSEKKLRTILKEKKYINFPIEIDNQAGCVQKKGQLSIAAIKKINHKNESTIKILVSPIKAKFNNISNP